MKLEDYNAIMTADYNKLMDDNDADTSEQRLAIMAPLMDELAVERGALSEEAKARTASRRFSSAVGQVRNLVRLLLNFCDV